MKNIDQATLQERIATMRRSIAAENSAMHSAHLNIARWRNAARSSAPATSFMPADQIRWHAQAQQHFQHWLAEGGFARAEKEDTGTNPGDSDETVMLASTACQHAPD